MTDSCEDGHHLVRVRAQVMIRDDSTGGWVPMGGGGLSNVSVRKRAATCELDPCKHEYLIFGKRISDQSVVLSCIIKKDFEYNKVMPTFHHWKTGEKKFGLTFQTAADARAFDKGLRTAVDELLDGITEPPLVHAKIPTEVGDDDVFMTLNLPVEHNDSRSSSNSSTATTLGGRSGASRHCTPPTPPFTSALTQEPPLPPRAKIPAPAPENDSPLDHYPAYVPLIAPLPAEQILYPTAASAGSCKKLSPDQKPKKLSGSSERLSSGLGIGGSISGGKGHRLRCRYCQELFVADENHRGACAFAPDWGRTVIDTLACVRCAQCVLYHCGSGDANFATVGSGGPCGDEYDDGCCNSRWLGLAVLSVLMPCLWLYPGLRACHWCGVQCGACGGRHHSGS